MAVVELIFDIKAPAWVIGNTQVLSANEFVMLSNGTYSFGDGVTQVQNLTWYGGSASPLSGVLTLGNTTGANDIVATNNSKYRNSDSSVNLNISNSGLIEFTNTDGTYTYALDSDATSQYIQMRSYDNATSLELAYFQTFYQQTNIGVYSSLSGGRLTQLEITNGEIKTNIVANATFQGIKYNADFSANYVPRSLVDYGFITGNYVPYTGATTNLNLGSNNLYFNTGQSIDVNISGGSDTLNIGTSNADVINIGYSGSTINIQGTLAYQNVTNLQVTDKLITLNKGGGVASGVSSGFEIEENAIITGWFATDATRTGWDFKAPASTYYATMLQSSLSANRTYTMPNQDGTFTVLGNTTTGSGSIVLGTQPTFTQWITVPRIYGGTGVNDGIDFYSTTGNGTSGSVAHRFLGGNNGATTILTMLNDGTIRIPNNRTIQGTDSIGTNRNLIVWSSDDNLSIIGRPGTTDINLNPTSGGIGLYVKSGGDGGIGVASPVARWHIIKTTEQLRVGYDTSNYVSYTVNSSGAMTIASSATSAVVSINNTLAINNAGFDNKMQFVRTGGDTYSIQHDAASLYLYNNTASKYLFRLYNAGYVIFDTPVASTGNKVQYQFTSANSTGHTAGANIPNLRLLSATKTWSAGALTNQYFVHLASQTIAFASASTATNVYGLYVEAATAGANAIITNNWSLGTNGGIFLNGTANTVLGNAALATNATTGFLHVPSCAGTPTGTPTLFTGMIPICADSTNNKLYIYSGGAWVALN